ncbi:unnamed protein product [Thlaspi arvense]|uniref:Jacalin-type lectin domain-containing protein n=1 Tax=Thlaspi arvense TaxID=13288 RepID=A0AAU9R9Q4_THLAR|nr:unnamed protein product [Thlaspi arvense]
MYPRKTIFAEKTSFNSNLFKMTQRLEAQGRKSSERSHMWDDGSDHDGVIKIIVRGDSRGIQYIWFDYHKSGKSGEGSYHGLPDPGFTQTFKINHQNDEQLESVEGYYEPKVGLIQGIQFKTNLRISEMIGFEKDGTKFSLSVVGKKIIGFHGSTSVFLQSLGAYFTWITPTRLEAKGGQGGKEWNDGADHEGVTKIYLRGGRDGIQFIKFNYVKNGRQIYGSDHGVSGPGGYTVPIEINHLNQEYLVSVEGYFDSGVIQGLEFKTNLTTSGLIGFNTGIKFRIAGNGKRIIGFHGYAEKKLISLGAYFAASPITKVEYRGGTNRGELWDDGAFEGVRKVYVTSKINDLRRVMFYYENGGKIKRTQHGYLEGQAGEFEVDYPNEFITSVEGTLYTIGDIYASVASLTFKTSKGRTSSTFGNATTNKFVLERKGCGLVGFHGRSTGALHAIGAYFRPLPPPPDGVKVEAKGGDGGASWDDGGFEGVRKIYIGLSQNAVSFIKFMYYKDARMVFGDDHGNKTLFNDKEFELNYPIEYVTSVEGSYDNKSGAITMLRFKTNTQTSPDFGLGTATDLSFELHKVDHKIVGFHGKSSGMLLHKIGVHMIQRLEAQGQSNSSTTDRWDDGSDHDGVIKIIVGGDSRGIQFIWFDYYKSGKSGAGSYTYRGSRDQGFTQTLDINHLNDEQLESVEGYYEPLSRVIKGLQFKTNLRISELIGFEKDCTKFSLSMVRKKIIGFHGSTYSALNSLGAYFTWITPTRLEARGGQGGKEWNDGADHVGVTKVYVRGGGGPGALGGIQFIKFNYVKNGQHIYGPAHGVSGASGYTVPC